MPSLIEHMLISLPYDLTDRVLFGSHRAAVPLQVIVQHLIGGPRPASFQLDGHTFHCETAHKYFFERENFERSVWETLRQQIGPQDVVYDIGAHFGFWAIRLSGLCKKVVAFEPSSINIHTVRRNAGRIPNVQIVNCAVGSVDGVVNFLECGSMSRVNTGDKKVTMMTVDSATSRYPVPSCLMIDVEGHAAEVLKGATKALAGVTSVVCEIHDPSEQEAVFGKLSGSYSIRFVDHDASRYPFRILASKAKIR